MAQSPINIPDFMKDYYEGSNPEGKARLETIAANYEKQRLEFMQNIYPGKAIFQDDWNRLTGQNKRLNPEELTRHIREEHRAEAEKVAKQSGYVDKAAQQKEAKAQPQPSAQTKQKPQQPMETQTQQPANTANETPKQQATQQAAQPERREAFLQAIQQQRQRQAQARQTQQAAPPPAPAPAAAGEQGNRERTLAQLQAMREQSQKMTQKPR